MIEGVVNASLEAVITLTLRGLEGQTREIEAVVDTGFNGFLTLPPSLVTELGLPFQSRDRVILANGREEMFDIHDATGVFVRSFTGNSHSERSQHSGEWVRLKGENTTTKAAE